VVDTSGFLVANPAASNAQFVQWAKSVHAMARFPELASIGYSVIVPAADLPAFAARTAIDWIFTSAITTSPESKAPIDTWCSWAETLALGPWPKG